MSRHHEPRIKVRRGGGMFPGRESVELVGVALRPSTHYTRLWPAEPGEQSARTAFLYAVLPVRIVAHALLWATSGPLRAAVAAALVLAALIR